MVFRNALGPGLGVVTFLVAATMLFVTTSIRAADSLTQLSLVALNTTDAQGRHWAYLVWQPSSDGAPIVPAVAVYAKAGDAGSANAYSRRAVVCPQTDPDIIAPLLNRAAQFGQNLAELEAAMDAMFGEVLPAGNLTLAQKVSAALRGAQNSPAHAVNLALLGRLHPGVALCQGLAHAEVVPGPAGTKTTFELRLIDLATDQDRAVVGRVTASAGQPVVLPAPGPPVEVIDRSAQGNLNVKWRWANPPELRRLSLVQHGFNVWRMTRAFAEQSGYDAAPPAPATLRSLAGSNPNVHRLNHTPVLTEKVFSAADVANFVTDPTTRFFADDNDQGDTDSALAAADFQNGSQFYYFVTARDLLGRDGIVSPGTLATVCDRMPPPPPSGVKVVSHYVYNALTGVGDQRLQVIWKQNPVEPDETTTAYHVYRWTSVTQLNARGADYTFNRIAGPIAHLPGSPTNSYRDAGPGAPSVPAGDAGKTFWYTVVAVDAGACAPGPNFSLHSGPGWGVLRDRAGPAGGGGSVTIACSRPVVTYAPPVTDSPALGLDPDYHHYRVKVKFPALSVAQVEFTAQLPAGPPGVFNTVGQRWVGVLSGDTAASTDFAILKTTVGTTNPPVFSCRVMALNGKVSNTASSSGVLFPPGGQLRGVPFEAVFQTTRVVAGGDCQSHDPNPPGSPTNFPVCIELPGTPTTKEYHVYRRVDDGPLTLLSQGPLDFKAGQVSATVCDESNTANPAEVCYFGQLFDEHGNPGPLQRLNCIKNEGTAPLPPPILAELESTGDESNPTMTVRWFYPPYPVERFEILIAGQPQAPVSTMFPGMGDPETLGFPITMNVPEQDAPWEYTRIPTRRVGPAFGTGPVWTVTGAVVPGNTYAVSVRALNGCCQISSFSALQTFTWQPTNPPTATPTVPWPARALLKPSTTNFPPALVVPRVFNNNNVMRPFEGLGVRVGEVTIAAPMPTSLPPGHPVFIPGNHDPMSFVYQNLHNGQSLFPVVMYRFQVPNAAFPTVSGDLIQVTPLMEQIAYDWGAVTGFGPSTLIHDPFIRVAAVTPGAPRHGVYLVDTQPVVRGAGYRYVLMRQHPETRELAELIVTNPVEVPE